MRWQVPSGSHRGAEKLERRRASNPLCGWPVPSEQSIRLFPGGHSVRKAQPKLRFTAKRTKAIAAAAAVAATATATTTTVTVTSAASAVAPIKYQVMNDVVFPTKLDFGVHAIGETIRRTVKMICKVIESSVEL